MKNQMKMLSYTRRALMLTTLFAGLAATFVFAQEASTDERSNVRTAGNQE
jgi:hypothetical protein